MAIGNETFMNLLTDFAFKRLFGTEEHKQILIRFLNILFEKDGLTVKDVIYHNKEILPSDKDGKVIKYDVYCTTPGEGQHFVVEMQQSYHPLFENRVAAYSAKAIAEQLKKGGKYDLKPVYSIWLVDFHFPHMKPKPFHDVRLMDTSSHEIFTNILRLMFIVLEEAKPTWEECENEYDKMVYLIKNMHKMDKNSKAYRSGEFADMFDASEITSMAAEDVVAYSASRIRLEEMEEAVDYAAKESFEKGVNIGRVEGRVEGIEAGLKLSAQKMIHAGLSIDFIHEMTGLSLNDIQELCKSCNN